MPTTSVLISGVGGQGVVLVSELLALAALAAGEDVKQGEFHGVAQRGGAVFSHVRFGDKVHSPIAPLATVDYLLALEKLEALRYAHYLKPAGEIGLELRNPDFEIHTGSSQALAPQVADVVHTRG